MALTKREERVIKAFINCIAHGEYTEDYAITLIEDDQRYGWLSNEAKDAFYELLEELNNPVESEPEPEVEPIPETDIPVTPGEPEAEVDDSEAAPEPPAA